MMRVWLVGVSMMIGSALSAGDWPSFRGNPPQTGTAEVDPKLPDTLALRWQFATGDAIENGAAIVGGVVYVGSLDEHLYAISLADGQLKWKQKLGPIKAVPTIHANTLFIGDIDGKIYALDPATGKTRWTFETEGEITSGSSISGDTILFASQDQTLYCLGQADGKLRWKFTTEGPVYGAPAVAKGRTFVAGCDSNLRIIDLKDGKEVGAVDLGGQTANSVAVIDRYLYLGTMANQVLGIDWQEAKVVWRYEAPRRRQAYFASPAVTDKLVVIGGRDRKITALDRRSGKEVWVYETGNRVDGSPVIAGSRVYAASMDKKLYVLELATGKLVQAIPLDSPSICSPAVADGALVIGTNRGTVYCFGKAN